MDSFRKKIDTNRIIICFFLVLMFFFVLVFKNTNDKITNFINSDPSENPYLTDQSISNGQEFFLNQKKDNGYKLKKLRDLSIEVADSKQATRHRVRWVVSSIESEIINFLQQNLSTKLAYYGYCLLLTIFISFSFIFCTLSIETITHQKNFKSALLCTGGFIFYLYPLYFELSDAYSAKELFALSACIYFSLKEKLKYFIIFAIFGALNRETGLLLPLIYPLINFKKEYYYVPLILVPLIFTIFNYDLLTQKAFYDLKTWVAVRDYKMEFDSLYFYSLLRILILIFPTIFLLIDTNKDDKLKIFLFIFILYFIALLLGTSITNIYAYIILAPLFLVINSYSFRS